MNKYLNITIACGLLGLSQVALACPAMDGTYQSEINSTAFYLQKVNESTYSVILDVPGYPLTKRDAHFASDEERKNHPYYGLPECTLNIANFGQLLPHKKGTPFYVHFDSRDFQKTFNTDYVLKIDETPNGLMGMNKSTKSIPDNALKVLMETK